MTRATKVRISTLARPTKVGEEAKEWSAWYECSACHGQVDFRATFCEHCGEEFK